MANTLKFGAGNWATKEGSTLAYNDENGNFKPLPFDFTRTSSATVVNKAGLIETVGNGIPRIDFLDNTKGALLLEPSRTNLIPYSEDFTQSTWQKQSAGVASAPVVTSNYSISPAGILNADRIIFNIEGGSTSSDFSQITDPVTVSGGDVSNSVYIKSNTTANYTMSLVKPDGNFTTILVTTEWQRFEVNASVPSASVAFRLRLRGSESTSGFADVSVWGAQLEDGSYATSYIPTQGSAATRVAGNTNQTPPDGVIGQTEGTMFFEIDFANISGVSGAWSISNGSSANRITMNTTTSSSTEFILSVAQNYNSGSTKLMSTNVTFSDNHKVAIKYSGTTLKLFVDGQLSDSVTTDGFGNYTNFYLGGNHSGVYGGDTRKFIQADLYNTALTDAELQSLTTI